MIKQDYLVRMIQEIITLIAQALLNKQKIQKQNWVEYDSITQQILSISAEKLIDMTPEEIIDQYQADINGMGKIELAAMTLLKISDEMEENQLLLKSKLHQNGLYLLKHVQNEGKTYSIQRMSLILLLENNWK